MLRALACAALLAVLVSGCSGAEPSPQAAPEQDDGRRSVGGGGEGSNRTRVWEHVVAWQTDAAPPPTTMVVPANLTQLDLEVQNTPTAPCGANVPDPATGQGPYAQFVSPSGAALRVDLSANDCSAGGLVVYSVVGVRALDEAEAGTWQVTFEGRGLSLEQRLVVEGS